MEHTGLRFNDLALRQRFNFKHDDEMIARALARGPWVKVGPRTYKHESDTVDAPPIMVGSTKVAVELSDSDWPLAF